MLYTLNHSSTAFVIVADKNKLKHIIILTDTIMDKYICDVCEWVYDPEVGDPENGIQPGTKFEDLPDDWVCPLCGVGKDQFSKVE